MLDMVKIGPIFRQTLLEGIRNGALALHTTSDNQSIWVYKNIYLYITFFSKIYPERNPAHLKNGLVRALCWTNYVCRCRYLCAEDTRPNTH